MAAEDMLDGDDPLGGCRGMMTGLALTVIVAVAITAWIWL